MKHFLIVCTLCIICLAGSVSRADAQYPGYGYGYGGYYPGYYGGVQYNFVPASGYGYGYSGNNPYSLYGSAASYPTLLNPNYVIGNNRVQVTRYKSPNIYAPRQYEYKPYPPR